MDWLKQNFIITNAELYDGSGADSYRADVAVKDNQIAAVAPAGELSTTGNFTFDAHGLALAPGFIDIHSHSDTAIVRTPSADSKISQGVTTEAVGNCGFSDWHVSDEPEMSELAERVTATGSFGHYADLLDELHPAINIAGFCGHNSLRLRTIGEDDRPATPAEIAQMKALLVRDLAEGACGFSSGLWYVPGKFASEAEVSEIATALRGTHKPYATHMRDEESEIIPAIQEAGRIARCGDGRLQISHFKVKGAANWHLQARAIAEVEKLRQSNLDVQSDRYPYLWTSTSLRMICPGPFARLERQAVTRLLASSPAKRQELRELLAQKNIDWSGVMPIGSLAPFHQNLAGKNLLEIAQILQLSPGDACVELLTSASPTAVFREMKQEHLDWIIDLPYVYPASDGSSRSFADAGTHPRAFGTFPRFFQLGRKRHAVPALIRRMSALPAQRLNLVRRGLIKAGYFADLVLLDLDHYASRADYLHPNTAADGVVKVWVNGVESYRAGQEQNPERYGQALRVANFSAQ